jgi:uncharacterized protein YciI
VYYILFYEVVEDHVTRRVPYREEHLRLLSEAHKRGELVMAGAFSEPVDGAALVFRADDAAVPTLSPSVIHTCATAWSRGGRCAIGTSWLAADAQTLLRQE